MPKKVPLETDWEPLDLRIHGSSIYSSLPRQKIFEYLSSNLPNWALLDEPERRAAGAVVVDALISLKKDQTDAYGLPGVPTVKFHLAQVRPIRNLTSYLPPLKLRTCGPLRRSGTLLAPDHLQTPYSTRHL